VAGGGDGVLLDFVVALDEGFHATAKDVEANSTEGPQEAEAPTAVARLVGAPREQEAADATGSEAARDDHVGVIRDPEPGLGAGGVGDGGDILDLAHQVARDGDRMDAADEAIAQPVAVGPFGPVEIPE